MSTVLDRPTDTKETLAQANTSDTIAVVNAEFLRDKIYTVRGVQVMLDYDLAEIYGYETKYFNRQVKNNAQRFEGDEFMFRLTTDEYQEILKCKNFTSSWGGSRYLPHAFTEQGIYMLMTVLKGELAVAQSRALVVAFKTLKDYIIENQGLIGYHDYLHLSLQMSDTQKTIHEVRSKLLDHEAKLNDVLEQLGEAVRKSDISPYMLDFGRQQEQREYLFLNGQPARAAETYIDIYSKAKQSIYIVDDYIDIKTLRLLQNALPSVTVTIFSDNVGNHLHLSDWNDFHREFPNIAVTFKRTNGTVHDRFIVLDAATSDERVFHCGASSKDAAVNRMTMITEVLSGTIRASFNTVLAGLSTNPMLSLA